MSDSSDLPATDGSGSDALVHRSSALVDDSLYASARAEADELGAASPDALTAETIRLIARLNGTRAAVCITPAPGVPALAILAAAGTRGGAVVTCITDDPHHLDAARAAVRGAGHSASSARYIAARPLEVADKLADGAYDMVVADVSAHSVTRLVSRSHQLLRSGGALVLIGEHAPLPEDADLPEHAHVTVLPVGSGLTVVTL
ncbi:MAG: methyltransferase domain-containing protein [Dietzia sp.]